MPQSPATVRQSKCKAVAVIREILGTCLENGQRSFCHNPTQPQLKLVVTKYMEGPPQPPHPTTRETFKALPDNPGGWFSVCNLMLTQLERRPHKINGRRPQNIIF